MCIKFEESKIHHSKRNTRFIQKRVHRKWKKFIKHRNMQAYRGKKEVQRVHQNDQKSLSCEIQGGQKFIQSRDERPKKKERKKKKEEARQAENPKGWSRQKLRPKKKIKENKRKKPVRLKTQKGGLGKSQGQRKEKKRILQDESLEV